MGSSRTRSGEPIASAHAIASRCRPPPDRRSGFSRATVPEPDAAQRRLGTLEDVGDRHPEILGAEGDLVEDGAGHELGVGVLEDHADARAEGRDGLGGRIEAGDQDPPLHRGRHRLRDEAVQRQGEGRLARTARPEDQDDLAGAHVEGDRGGGRGIRPLVGDRKILDRQEGLAESPPRVRRTARVAVRSRIFPLGEG